jgi:hypothetical protein
VPQVLAPPGEAYHLHCCRNIEPGRTPGAARPGYPAECSSRYICLTA